MYIQENSNKYTVKDMCIVLMVGESGYYRRNKRGSKPRARQLLLVEISNILSEHPDNGNYGIDRIQTALSQRGMTREQVKRDIFRYIFGYYNTLRVNSFNPKGATPIPVN